MESQINNDFEEMTARYDQQNIPKPDDKDLLEQVTERLIIEELQLQMADRAGIRISDSELNQTMGRVAANNQMELQDFIASLEKEGTSYEDLREQIRNEMIIQRIQRGRVQSEIDITAKEFEAFLATDESLLELEPQLLVKQILVKTLNEANSAIDRINNGEDFSEIAKEISISSNAANGGLMPLRKAAEWCWFSYT